MSTNVNDVDIALITIKKPKKYESLYVCKMVYDDSKFDVAFDGVELLEIKQPSTHDVFLYFRLDKKQLDSILCIEDAVIKKTIENVPSWFKQKMNTSLIEDYFEPNIIVDKRYSKVFKCRLTNTDITSIDKLDSFINKRVNIVLRANTLRFTKQKYMLTWQVLDINPAFYFDDINDDENENYCEYTNTENDLGFVIDELYEEICVKLSNIKVIVDTQLTKATLDMDMYQDIMRVFDRLATKDERSKLDDIEIINDMLDKMKV